MNSSHIMIVMIVLIVMVASVMRARYAGHRHRSGPPAIDDAEARRMHEEMRVLKERVAVLERIATDRNHLLEQEIDQLRDR